MSTVFNLLSNQKVPFESQHGVHVSDFLLLSILNAVHELYVAITAFVSKICLCYFLSFNTVLKYNDSGYGPGFSLV